MTSTDRERVDELIGGIRAEYASADEAREGLMALLMRRIEAARFGTDDLDTEDLLDLAHTWSFLNEGMTGSEVALDWVRKMGPAAGPGGRED